MSITLYEVPEDFRQAPSWCHQVGTDDHLAAMLGTFADGDTDEFMLVPGLLNGETPVMVMVVINWNKLKVAPVGLFLPDLLSRDDIHVEVPGIGGEPVFAARWRKFCEPFNAARKAVAKAFQDALDRYTKGGGDLATIADTMDYGYGMYL